MDSRENLASEEKQVDFTPTEEVSAGDNKEKTENNQHTQHPRRESSIKSKSVLKQGHLRVKEDGQKVYKKTPSQAIMAATQLGIGYSVGRLTARQERDILMVDFYFVEKVWFPGSGTKETPSHKHNDFRFKSYAPVAFRYFRDLFAIQPSDFLLSLANEQIREISNPGASGSLFFLSNDDMFIVKTVQHKEATFLQQLLPGYYMNIHQNPRTLLPKFFGLYCYQSGTSNIRLTVMNNLLPSRYKCHKKFDLKGSTYKRKASKGERDKKSPTWKDLDFLEQFPNGIVLDAETYDAVIKTISRDVRVLESFNIMDYSFLLGIHNIDVAERERAADRAYSMSQDGLSNANPDREARKNEFGAALEAIPFIDEDEDEVRPHGGVPAKNEQGERLILFMGIIDILQSFRMAKKMEHRWKSLLTDGDTVSVHRPKFYSERFLNFIKDKVFYRCAVQRVNTKRRSVRATSEVFHDKAEIIARKNEEISPEVPLEKTNRQVKIVEHSLNGSIDYLSNESNASSEDLLDEACTSDDLSSVNTSQINIEFDNKNVAEIDNSISADANDISSVEGDKTIPLQDIKTNSPDEDKNSGEVGFTKSATDDNSFSIEGLINSAEDDVNTNLDDDNSTLEIESITVEVDTTEKINSIIDPSSSPLVEDSHL